MKFSVSLLSRLLLVVCLTLYGPLGNAEAGTKGAVFSMEICAGGVAKTVLVDVNGIPVEPAHDCHECLTCCHATGAQLNASSDNGLSISLLEIEMTRVYFQNPDFQNKNTRPMPRAPPALYPSMLDTNAMIYTDQTSNRYNKRSDGRPTFKDATA